VWPACSVGAVTMNIGIFVFEGAEELDFAGPYEVLAAWAQNWPDDDVDVFTVAQETGTITCAKGLRIEPKHTWDSAPPLDVVVYPGGQGNRKHLGDETIGSWLKDLHKRGTLMTSVCTGALVFADHDLLDGRPATTHWMFFDEMVALGRDIKPERERRFVDDGDVITSAGVSAGIDMALHLVARLHSKERAREVRRVIQYDPEPPV
jgi:transcriptional regulator GlxA family with amidase domain